MPKGDPAGYLPNVKKSRKKKSKKRKSNGRDVAKAREDFVKTVTKGRK